MGKKTKKQIAMRENYKLNLNAIKIESVSKNDDDGMVRVSGYACHFGRANHNDEIVDEKSFERFFNDLGEGGLMPMFNFQHDDTKIIGGWDKVESREDGLWAEGHLNTKCEYVAKYILPLVECGDVTHLSTQGGCSWNDIDYREDGSYYIKNFILTGISLVALPADFGARADIVNKIKIERNKKTNDNKLDLSLIY